MARIDRVTGRGCCGDAYEIEGIGAACRSHLHLVDATLIKAAKQPTQRSPILQRIDVFAAHSDAHLASIRLDPVEEFGGALLCDAAEVTNERP